MKAFKISKDKFGRNVLNFNNGGYRAVEVKQGNRVVSRYFGKLSSVLARAKAETKADPKSSALIVSGNNISFLVRNGKVQ